MKRYGYRGAAQKSMGYTIVETMIFLAVSGGLLFSAAAIITGRQEKVRFTQAVEGMQLQLQDSINDVATGFFPSNDNVTCTSNGNQVTDLNSNAAEQGSNTGCVFVGKYIEFNPEQSSYTSYTMVKSKEASNLFDGNIMLLGYGNESGIAETRSMQADMFIRGSGAAVSSGVRSSSGELYKGIVVANSYDSSGEATNSSGAKVRLYGFSGDINNQGFTPVNTTSIDQIDDSVVLCMEQLNGRKAALTLTKQLTFDRSIDGQPGVCTA